jgi:outer membrane cobalamin receptor
MRWYRRPRIHSTDRLSSDATNVYIRGADSDQTVVLIDGVKINLAAAWALNDQKTIIRASFGEGFKAPSLYELYSNYGNLALHPEQARSWDAGVEQRSSDARVVISATYFQRKSDDLILFLSCPAPIALCATEPQGVFANVARASARGVELQGSFNPNERLGLLANYTLTETEDRSPGSPTYGQELPNRPKNMVNASATYRRRLRPGQLDLLQPAVARERLCFNRTHWYSLPRVRR